MDDNGDPPIMERVGECCHVVLMTVDTAGRQEPGDMAHASAAPECSGQVSKNRIAGQGPIADGSVNTRPAPMVI